MISISLFEKFGCQNFTTSIKVINMTGHSSKTNKLRNINIGQNKFYDPLSVNLYSNLVSMLVRGSKPLKPLTALSRKF